MNSRLSLFSITAVFALTLTIGTSAFADGSEEEFAKCHENATSTAEMHECMSKEFSYYDAKLNALYKELRKQSSGADADSKEITKRLVEAQRSWIKFRDANCSYEATSMLGGTGEGLIAHGCSVRMTKQRVLELSSQQ